MEVDSIAISVVWIKAEFGGRSSAPIKGLRPIIRFQRYIEDWLSLAKDVEVIELEIDQISWAGTAKLQFTVKPQDNMRGLKIGELIELLDAYRVIAVGKIIEIN